MTTNAPEPYKNEQPAPQDSDAVSSIVFELQEALAMDESPGGNQVVYVIAHPHGLYKIGISQEPMQRLEDIQEANPYKLELIAFNGFKNAVLAEEILHAHFSEGRVRGEWFDIHDELIPILFEENCNKNLGDIVRDHDAYPGSEGL